LSSGKKRSLTGVKSHKQFDERGVLGKSLSKNKFEGMGWGTIKEHVEEEKSKSK
jgi:hypothetical protein